MEEYFQSGTKMVSHEMNFQSGLICFLIRELPPRFWEEFGNDCFLIAVMFYLLVFIDVLVGELMVLCSELLFSYNFKLEVSRFISQLVFKHKLPNLAG